MQKTNNNSVKVARRQTKSSTTVNRRRVKRPTDNKKVVDSMIKKPINDVHKREMKKPSYKVYEKAEIMPEPEAIMTQINGMAMEKSFEEEMHPMMAKIVAVEEPVEVLVDDPVEEVMEPPVEAEMKISIEESAMGSMEGMREEMMEEPAEEMIEEKVEEPMVQMMEDSTERTMKEPMERVEKHPIQHVANSRMKARTMSSPQVSKVTAQELKERAIKKAMSSASSMSSSEQTMKNKTKSKKTGGMRFSFGRVMLALSCATAAVFAILYFVNMSMPDISLKVAAMQTGINASYPGYVPRDYSVSSITSEDGKITIVFKNSKAESEFTLIEESSSWDSNALLTNYVKEAFDDSYATVREQGLTLYVDGSNAAWVNGGIVYKIRAVPGTLTNKQIRSIATSM